MAFKQAVRTAKKAKIALDGPSGSGKTATALRLARGLAGPDGKVAVIDTERGSASLYAGRFGGAWDVDDEMPDYSPKGLMARIREAEAAGYAALVVDSLSHFWMGTGGELEMVDAAKKRTGGNGFAGWKEVTPIHNDLIQCILTSRLHIVCTMRTKVEWVVEKDERGKNVPKKIGTAPVQRDGMDFEFDLYAHMQEAEMVVAKTRLEVVPLNSTYREPGEALGEKIGAWLGGAPAAPEKPAPAPAPPRAATPGVPVYEQAMAFLKGAEAPGKVDEALRRAKAKVTPIEYAALETVGRQRKEALARLAAPPPGDAPLFGPDQVAGDGPGPGREPEDDAPF
jgi:DNA polymerase III delta prime subunit